MNDNSVSFITNFKNYKIVMPAFKRNFQLIDISYYYDTLTIYFNFDVYSSKEYERFNQFYSNLKWSRNFKDYIHGGHDEHDLYHVGIKSKNEHVHLKFHMMLKPEHISNILDKLIQYDLLTPHGKSIFMYDFLERYNNINKDIIQTFSGHAIHDRRFILKLIKSCEDNDILVHLHQFLQKEEFDYLRNISSAPQLIVRKSWLGTLENALLFSRQYLPLVSFYCLWQAFYYVKQTNYPSKQQWQGTDREGKIVKTSKTWAVIEKSFALQMAINVKNNCEFNKNISSEFSNLFATSHLFFSIKRKTNTNKILNNTYQHFKNADDKLIESYEKHFCRYR